MTLSLDFLRNTVSIAERTLKISAIWGASFAMPGTHIMG